MPATVQDEQNAWLIFQKYSDHAWPYTDCAIFALARRVKIHEVFAFDRRFGQMPGLACVP